MHNSNKIVKILKNTPKSPSWQSKDGQRNEFRVQLHRIWWIAVSPTANTCLYILILSSDITTVLCYPLMSFSCVGYHLFFFWLIGYGYCPLFNFPLYFLAVIFSVPCNSPFCSWCSMPSTFCKLEHCPTQWFLFCGFFFFPIESMSDHFFYSFIVSIISLSFRP